MDLVAGASKFTVNNLGSLLAQEYTLIRGARDDIQYITDELSSMQAFLSRLKRAEHNDEQQEDWMKQVREVAEDIEDHVDYVRLRLGGEPRGSGTLMSVRRSWYLLTTLYARHCIATEIRNLKVRAQHVSERRTRYGAENLACCCRCRRDSDGVNSSAGFPPVYNFPPPPPSVIGNMAPVGMEDSMEKLKEWFTETQYTNTRPSFVAITGFGGSGKTTLAMALYHKFGDEFDCKASVLASGKFVNLPTVLRSLVKQLHEKHTGASKSDLHGIEELEERELKEKLAEQLKDQRYLLLIDDIWSVAVWENIVRSLPTRTEKGGTIVVTTRFKSVAEACRRQQGCVHQQKLLNGENAYKLFCQVIHIDPEHQTPGAIDILKTCRGLPLAIILFAGLVAAKLTSYNYHEIGTHMAEAKKDCLGQELWNNSTTEIVMTLLNYCYNHLPADLKTCLLYMSMFPKGYWINRKRLIRRWIAERFISEKYKMTAEEVAEDCFSELIGRNLIRPVSYNSNGKVKSCKIDDMVLEYIVSKSSDENFVTVVGGHWQMPLPCDRNFSNNNKAKVRWLSVHKSDWPDKEMVKRMKPSHVRSLMMLGSFKALHSTLIKFQILEVLDLEDCKDFSVNHLKKICEMRQLKYLSLRGLDLDRIPNNVSSLEYLEVLDIRGTKIRKLPSTVERLQRMAHLLAGDKRKRVALQLTEGITKMTALQTLCGVNICIALALASLENLTNLKKFTIYKINCTVSNYELLLSAIEHLSSCSLKSLAIDDDFTGFLDTALKVSQALPEHLHTLELSGKLSQVPDWICNLQSLEKLTLSLTLLTTKTLRVLAELPELFSLIFSLDSTRKDTSVFKILHDNTINSGGMIFVPAGGFIKLKLLRFAAPVVPPLSFLEGAMPLLQKIELRFKMVEGVYGLENLASIEQVVLNVSSQAPEDAKEKASQVKKLASMIIPGKGNALSVVIDEYNESEE